jgi:hypothetical protein
MAGPSEVEPRQKMTARHWDPPCDIGWSAIPARKESEWRYTGRSTDAARGPGVRTGHRLRSSRAKAEWRDCRRLRGIGVLKRQLAELMRSS